MTKHLMDLRVVACERIHSRHVLLRLTTADGSALPETRAGQFAQLQTSTLLRRPISICSVDRAANEIVFLVQIVGQGSRWLSERRTGDVVSALLPLGNGFTMPKAGERRLLVGGGVGVAPMLSLGEAMREAGHEPTFLLGARTKDDALLLPRFEALGRVCLTTEDGSAGERGFVTNHSVLAEPWDGISSCGPKPMMLALAREAKARGIALEVSLENMMACGLGACLCCVEDTKEKGHVCVCTEGPVFNIDDLRWQI